MRCFLPQQKLVELALSGTQESRDRAREELVGDEQ